MIIVHSNGVQLLVTYIMTLTVGMRGKLNYSFMVLCLRVNYTSHTEEIRLDMIKMQKVY